MILVEKGIVKKAKPHDNLSKFLLLKNSIPDILFFKKIKKTLNDILHHSQLKSRCDSLVKAKKDTKKGGSSKGKVKETINPQLVNNEV